MPREEGLRHPRKGFRCPPGMESCLKKLVWDAEAAGFQDPERGGWESMTLSEIKLCSVGPKRMYVFDCRKAKKLIPVHQRQMND